MNNLRSQPALTWIAMTQADVVNEERRLQRGSGGHETIGLLAPSPHHGHELLVGHWLAEDVALAEMTTQSHDRLRILDGLDAYGRCRALEVLGELDHALADARIALVAAAALH